MTPVMSALFGVLAGIASLLAMMWVVVQVHKSRVESIVPEPQNDPECFEPWWIPKQPFQVLRVSDAFDPELCILWDSQATALGFICDSAEHGVLSGEVALIHRLMAARHPELYDGSGFEEWLRFLEGCDLIRRKGDRVFITTAGAKFVASCLHGAAAKVGGKAA